MFIVGGAFDGIETIVKNRLGEKTIGFGKNNKKIDEDASIMQQIIPEDLLKFGLIPEFYRTLASHDSVRKTYNRGSGSNFNGTEKCFSEAISKIAFL